MKHDNNKINWLVTGLIIVTIVMFAVVLFTIFSHKESLTDRIHNDVVEQVRAEIQSAEVKRSITPVKDVDYRDGIDGLTPVKGRDYFDGVDGKNGRDAPRLQVRCNDIKNRWEQRYDNNDIWTVQMGASGQPVKCTIIPILPLVEAQL